MYTWAMYIHVTCVCSGSFAQCSSLDISWIYKSLWIDAWKSERGVGGVNGLIILKETWDIMNHNEPYDMPRHASTLVTLNPEAFHNCCLLQLQGLSQWFQGSATLAWYWTQNQVLHQCDQCNCRLAKRLPCYLPDFETPVSLFLEVCFLIAH